MLSSSMNRNVIKDMNEKNVMLNIERDTIDTPLSDPQCIYIGAFNNFLEEAYTYDTM